MIYEQLFNKVITKQQAVDLNPLVLAFVGDAVYSLYIKTQKIDLLKCKVKALNLSVANKVNAKSQRDKLFKIYDKLSEDEQDIVRRARNTNMHSRAKNFSVEEYRHATAFEALIGYLFLTNNLSRLNELLNLSEE